MRPILSESHEQEFSTTTQQHMQTLVLGRVPSTTTVRTMLTRSSIPPVQEYSTATRNRPSISQEQECSTTIQDTMLTRPSISYEQEHYKTPDSAQPMHDSITAVFTTSTRPSISYEQALPKTPDPAEAQERSTTAVFTMPTRPSIRPDSVIIPAPHKHDIRYGMGLSIRINTTIIMHAV